MVAIWGLESNFGRFTGTYPTVRALATLAYDNRRPLFRTELLQALAMIDRGVAPGDMKGSWAGAMGQPQFMPSSFLHHAVDFDGDGRIDIWSSIAGRLRVDGALPAERGVDARRTLGPRGADHDSGARADRSRRADARERLPGRRGR